MDLDAKLLGERLKDIGAHLGHAEVQAVAPYFQLRKVARDETLITAGEAVPAAWIIMDGGFVVRARVSGKDVAVVTLSPGMLLGEVSFLDGGPATATVVATTYGEVAMLDHASFEHLDKEHPREAMLLHHAFMRTLASRLRSATEHLERLRSQDGTQPRDVHVDAFGSMFGIGLLP